MRSKQREAMIAPGVLEEMMVDSCALGEVAEPSCE
jgi:hypothetical protein